MADEIIPDDIKQFLLQHIDSIAQWEGLLLLRAHPQTAWSASAVASNLYICEARAAEILAQLAAQEFIVPATDPSLLYRYSSATAPEEIIGRAAELYTRYLVPVTNLIHSKPPSRIQKFADAFRLRKE